MVSTCFSTSITADALSRCLACPPPSTARGGSPLILPSSLWWPTDAAEQRHHLAHVVPSRLGPHTTACFAYGHHCAVQPWAARHAVTQPGLAIKQETELKFRSARHQAGQYWWVFISHSLHISEEEPTCSNKWNSAVHQKFLCSLNGDAISSFFKAHRSLCALILFPHRGFPGQTGEMCIFWWGD